MVQMLGRKKTLRRKHWWRSVRAEELQLRLLLWVGVYLEEAENHDGEEVRDRLLRGKGMVGSSLDSEEEDGLDWAWTELVRRDRGRNLKVPEGGRDF